jgi:hypothetical protein
MQWSDVTRPASDRQLRQFAAIGLAVFGGLATWRAATGRADVWAIAQALAGALVGTVGLARPQTIRWLFRLAMIVAFPIGWVVSHVVLAVIFYGVFTPVALVFRLIGRDALQRRSLQAASLWTAKDPPRRASSYFRQF